MAVESGRKRGNYTWRWFGMRFGYERSPIGYHGSLYMDRWIVYLFSCTLRLHKICRPDRDRALHNHPFAFVTFPLGEYREIYAVGPDEDFGFGAVPAWLRKRVSHDGWIEVTRTVRRFVPQFRGIKFRHRIVALLGGRPVYTIVLTGPYRQQWGFFPDPLTFEPFKPTKEYPNDAP